MIKEKVLQLAEVEEDTAHKVPHSIDCVQLNNKGLYVTLTCALLLLYSLNTYNLLEITFVSTKHWFGPASIAPGMHFHCGVGWSYEEIGA